MDKIRELFHKIANQLNSMSLIAGSAKEEMKTSSILGDKNQQLERCICTSLERIENKIVELSGTLDELREIIKPPSQENSPED